MPTATRSAAATFASIEELLLILADYVGWARTMIYTSSNALINTQVNDKSTLWSLCLSSWRFNCVFTSKLSERITVRIEKDDNESFVKRIVDGLITGPYLHDLRHLQLIINNGPDFPKAILEIIDELLKYTPNLEIFT